MCSVLRPCIRWVGGVLDVVQAEHVADFVHDDGSDDVGSRRVLKCFLQVRGIKDQETGDVGVGAVADL